MEKSENKQEDLLKVYGLDEGLAVLWMSIMFLTIRIITYGTLSKLSYLAYAILGTYVTKSAVGYLFLIIMYTCNKKTDFVMYMSLIPHDKREEYMNLECSLIEILKKTWVLPLQILIHLSLWLVLL